MSDDMDTCFVGLPRHTLFDLLRMCTDMHMQRGFEPTYVRVIREAVEKAIKPVDSEREAIAKVYGPALVDYVLERDKRRSEPLCVKPDAFAHWSDEECTWCWADRSDVNEEPCKHHMPCLVCNTHLHSACMHDVSTPEPVCDVCDSPYHLSEEHWDAVA